MRKKIFQEMRKPTKLNLFYKKIFPNRLENISTDSNEFTS